MKATTIYLDNNATTPIAPEVAEAIEPYLRERFFNPSSMYEAARTVSLAVQEGREEIAGFLAVSDPRQIFFTSCATESNNWAVFGAAAAKRDRKHIITTSVEHPAVLEVCREMERRGHDVTYLPVDKNGQLDTAEFARSLRRNTLLVSIMHANNETGVIFPVAELARIAKETDEQIIFHTDATQTAGKLPLDLDGELRHIDMLSFSGHKLHAPKGIGALFIRAGTPCRPLIIGGHQERGRRAGTENTAFIVGLARACRLAAENRASEERVRNLRDRLEEGLRAGIPHLEINGAGSQRLPNTTSLACHSVEGESMLYRLDEEGICASSGSACTSGSLEPSHVLRAMDTPATALHGSIRFSLSRYNTASEINRLLEVFPLIVKQLRAMSPFWDQVKETPR